MSPIIKALQLGKELENKNLIALHLGNIGNVYQSIGQAVESGSISSTRIKTANNWRWSDDSVVNAKHYYDKSFDYYQDALQTFRELKNKNGIAAVLGNIGTLYSVTGKFFEAEKYLKESLALCDSMGVLGYMMEFEKSLSNLYEKSGNYKLAYIHFKKSISIRDTINSGENQKKLVRAEMNYQFEKKETAVKAKQDKKDAITAEEKRRQKVITYSVSMGLFLVLLLALFIFIGYRQKQKANKELAEKNSVIREQKKIVEEAHKNTMDSIEYAKRIQVALLTREEYLGNNFGGKNNFFIFFQPKDVISGDFYWGYTPPLSPQSGEQSFFLATADCTGHGVPGTLMSVLGISFLNELIIERNIHSPEEILNALRSEIITHLNPEGKEDIKDGMDMTLCRFSFKHNVLDFASANRPLLLVRNGNARTYSGDEMPVGVNQFGGDKSFTLQTIELKKDDIIYMFSDGINDQFGGPKNKKFSRKNVENLFLSIHNLPMTEQKTAIEKAFNEWKGTVEQTDDVTVMGIRI